MFLKWLILTFVVWLVFDGGKHAFGGVIPLSKITCPERFKPITKMDVAEDVEVLPLLHIGIKFTAEKLSRSHLIDRSVFELIDVEIIHIFQWLNVRIVTCQWRVHWQPWFFLPMSKASASNNESIFSTVIDNQKSAQNRCSMDKCGRDIGAAKWLSVSFFKNMEVACFKPWGIGKRELVTECNPLGCRYAENCDRWESCNNCGGRINPRAGVADRHATFPCNR